MHVSNTNTCTDKPKSCWEEVMRLPPLLVSQTKLCSSSSLALRNESDEALGFPASSVSSIKCSPCSQVCLPWMAQPRSSPLAASTSLKWPHGPPVSLPCHYQPCLSGLALASPPVLKHGIVPGQMCCSQLYALHRAHPDSPFKPVFLWVTSALLPHNCIALVKIPT